MRKRKKFQTFVDCGDFLKIFDNLREKILGVSFLIGGIQRSAAKELTEPTFGTLTKITSQEPSGD